MHSQRAKSLILPWSLFSLRMQAWPCFPRQQLLKGWTLLSLSSIDKLLHLLPYLHLLSSLKGCLRESHDIILLHLEPFSFYMLACWSFFRLTICSQNASPLSYSSVCKIFLVSLFGYVIIIRFSLIFSATSLIFHISQVFLVWINFRLTLSLNLYYVAINYTTATFAAATTNTIPAITFVLAGLLR